MPNKNKTLSQQTLGICDFTWKVLQNRYFQDFPTTITSPPKTCQKQAEINAIPSKRWPQQMKKQKLFLFQISFRKCPKNGPRRGGGKSNLMFFLTWMHFGRQGLPMELPSDFQGHFYMIWNRFGHIFGSLFAKKGRDIKTKSNKVTEKRICRHSEYALKKNNARWRGWAKHFGYVRTAVLVTLFRHVWCCIFHVEERLHIIWLLQSAHGGTLYHPPVNGAQLQAAHGKPSKINKLKAIKKHIKMAPKSTESQQKWKVDFRNSSHTKCLILEPKTSRVRPTHH